MSLNSPNNEDLLAASDAALDLGVASLSELLRASTGSRQITTRSATVNGLNEERPRRLLLECRPGKVARASTRC
jgi:hypothetical protein